MTQLDFVDIDGIGGFMKLTAVRLCATAAAVASIAGGLTLAEPAAASAYPKSGSCDTHGSKGRSLDCDWQVQDYNVYVTITNTSSVSSIRCDVEGISLEKKSIDLRPRAKGTVVMKRDPEWTRWYDVDCKSFTDQRERIEQTSSFAVRGD
ncbi:hypothetical protein [Gordonia sp. ABSL49_1]|uniref:hypothetical protein n=1 Tax=unclassified Gordonia (in: high G+C Gram-positive bacteria) TaxID=2657482 RepID=UPI001F1120D7|nr:hypothetical protein [Gordonia sp. ABSL49_1]MCH5642910.1 hypothetical protein [Gordonia sp. ABSL49_1]